MEREARAEYLVETYADTILRLSYSYLRNIHDAQDVSQTVLMKLFTADGHFESPEHERAWVLRVTANACKDVLKSPWRQKTCALEAAGALGTPPQEPEGEVLSAVNQLPAAYRSAIYLHYYEGYTAEEIGEIEGVRPNTIYTRLARGREKLKELLKEEGYHEQTV